MQGNVRGVLLLALGYPTYGNWAAQLAASIHYTAPEIPICLLTDGKSTSELAPEFRKHISEVVIPEEYYTKDGMSNYLKAKTFMYDLSPFDETIFLDADMIWLPYKPITQLFDQFKGIDFTMICRSDRTLEESLTVSTHCHWVKGQDIVDSYPEIPKAKKFYNVASEFVYFKKTEKNKAFFELVKQFYVEPKVPYRDFGLQVPDELAFTLAMLHTDIKPHQDNFVPIYWEHHQRKKLPLAKMYEQFYGYSAGGNVTDEICKSIWNDLAKMYSQRMGLKFWYPMRSKMEFILERKHI